jgi:AraC-like DNA-binding protein
MRDGRGVSLAAMATAAGLEQRTLLRRFASATGMTPIEYCRTVRIARARELLEGGEAERDRLAAELKASYPAIEARLGELIAMIEQNDRDIEFVRTQAWPTGAERLVSAELVAREHNRT